MMPQVTTGCVGCTVAELENGTPHPSHLSHVKSEFPVSIYEVKCSVGRQSVSRKATEVVAQTPFGGRGSGAGRKGPFLHHTQIQFYNKSSVLRG